MTSNDILRSLRYLMDLSEIRLAEVIGLGGGSVTREELAAYLAKEDEAGFRPCPDEVLAQCLDGLVVLRRGKDESRPAPPLELPVSNNQVLKKLRVAFELKEDDIRAVLEEAGLPLSKPEVSALFRKVGHSNYRPCGDQLLRNFLKGLTRRLRSR